MQSAVKLCGSTKIVLLILVDLSVEEVGRIRGVAEKFIDITQTADGEGSLVNYN